MSRFSKKSPKLLYNAIQFKSQLELNCFKLFEENDLLLSYESKSFLLISQLKLNNLTVYLPSRKTKKNNISSLKEISGILQKAIYTPDFILEYKNYIIFIETKGLANDAYPLRRKLFFHYLEKNSIENNINYIFFEPHNIKQILECINIIKNL